MVDENGLCRASVRTLWTTEQLKFFQLIHCPGIRVFNINFIANPLFFMPVINKKYNVLEPTVKHVV
jgi:hypothetical protein